MFLRRLGAAAALGLLVAACQAPAPPTPTALPPAPQTPVPTQPTATPNAVAPPASTAGRVDTLNTASQAYRIGDLKNAAGLYERVVNTPPAASESPAAATAVTDFAHFRAMLALLGEGSEDDAKLHLDALQQRDSAAPFARLATQVWDQYGMTGQLRGACAQVAPQVASQAGDVLATLQGAGVTIDAPTLCTVPQA